jgi:predicted nucleic acid-binding protein
LGPPRRFRCHAELRPERAERWGARRTFSRRFLSLAGSAADFPYPAGGIPIGPNDMLIAAHALSHGLTVVTDNTAEFKRVKGLKVENWRE